LIQGKAKADRKTGPVSFITEMEKHLSPWIKPESHPVEWRRIGVRMGSLFRWMGGRVGRKELRA
jgi:hypothetical protein